ncbi:MAG: PD-(D/E)XK nuclease family protein [Candidatus Competibacteraceae bacterium]|nr:PD-(D/E)XK nuclease family protein [Candidatus Competibacteraceae bacterium]
MNKAFDSDGLQFAWDSSSLELAMTCPRKYYYRMILGVAPTTSSVHLLFGGIFAKAVETFYKLRASGSSIHEATVAVVGLALRESWDPATGQPKVFDDSAKTRSTLIRSIVWYIEEYADESESAMTTVHLEDGTPAVELSFSLEFADGLLYCGHLDRVVDYMGGRYWLDNKTTKAGLTPFFFQSYTMSSQFFGYTWAGQTILRSPIKGGIIDAIGVQVGATQFMRQPITYTAERVAEWYENTCDVISLMRSYTALRKFPMNLTACGNYGGCGYKELCARSPRIRDVYLQSNYHQDVWDPLTPRN